MALRIRKDGTILCAANTKAAEGDVYLDDNIHYHLSVLTKAIVASENHKEDNLWFWNISPQMNEHYHKIKNYLNERSKEIPTE